MASPNNAVNTQTSTITTMIAGVDVFETEGRDMLLPGFNFITPVALATASTPDNARTIPTNPFQCSPKDPESGCRLLTASPRCGMLMAPNRITTSTVGTDIRNANPPV